MVFEFVVDVHHLPRIVESGDYVRSDAWLGGGYLSIYRGINKVGIRVLDSGCGLDVIDTPRVI